MENFEIYTYLKSKNGGGEPVPVPVTNPALRLMDWEGTVLKEYTAEQVASLTALPNPSSLNTNVDRDLLTFQGYNWSIGDIKAWVTAHEGQSLTVGAIYTTTDGQDHTYWDNPAFDTLRFATVQKRGTTSIGSNAFQYCSSLESISIPDGVTSIGAYAFRYCTSLESINIPDNVTSIGNYAFATCTSLESINIPDSVTSIGDGAFQYCTSLKNINIPDTVTSIGSIAFQYCTSLKNINIPDSVTSIGSIAFQYCTSLKNINIPDTVTSIGASTFQYCASLNGIVIQGKPELSNVNAFAGIYSGCLIYVPRDYLSWYENATNWTTLYNNNKIATIEDNIEYLESIGIDV